MNKNLLRTAMLCLAVAFLLVLLPAFGVSAGKERLDWAIIEKLTVLRGTFLQGDLDLGANNITSVDDIDAETVTADYLPGRSVMLRYQDVKDDTGGNVLTATSVATTTTVITTGLTSPDYPRNIVITLDSDAQRAAGDIVVSGVDARGEYTAEILRADAITDTQTLTGVVPWATLDMLDLPTQTGAITVTVSLGKKFGLGKLPDASADVFAFTKNHTHITGTVNTTYGTVEPASVSANDDLTIWYKE